MPIPEFGLEGKRAIVVAGSRGIGKGIALALADAGADVAVASLTPANAEKAAAQIRALGRHSKAYQVDATDADSVAKLAEASIREFGPLDVVVNALGDALRGAVAPRPGLDERVMSPDDWRTFVDINLTEAFLGCHHFGPHLLERRQGTVINVSSFGAFRARPLFTAYDTSKAALIQLTRGVALEWAPYGVTCNCIAPGNFPDRDQMPPDRIQAFTENVVKNIPLGRVGELREVGLLAVYLASDAAKYVTGQTIAIDGGMSISPTIR